jgi:hypothetical protein
MANDMIESARRVIGARSELQERKKKDRTHLVAVIRETADFLAAHQTDLGMSGSLCVTKSLYPNVYLELGRDAQIGPAPWNLRREGKALKLDKLRSDVLREMVGSLRTELSNRVSQIDREQREWEEGMRDAEALQRMVAP